MNQKLTVCILVLALVMAANSMPQDIKESDEAKRFLYGCDIRCLNGGCQSWEGRCWGMCYCYGSGYEYRCRSCDL